MSVLISLEVIVALFMKLHGADVSMYASIRFEGMSQLYLFLYLKQKTMLSL